MIFRCNMEFMNLYKLLLFQYMIYHNKKRKMQINTDFIFVIEMFLRIIINVLFLHCYKKTQKNEHIINDNMVLLYRDNKYVYR